MRTLARGIPYTILRAAQFFEFLGQIIDAGAESDHVRLTTGLMQSSHLRIDPRRDGQPWLADTASLAQSLIEAHERLAASWCPPRRSSRCSWAFRRPGGSHYPEAVLDAHRAQLTDPGRVTARCEDADPLELWRPTRRRSPAMGWKAFRRGGR
jgi:hypothetical protein